MRFACFA
jgi:hypothetical protein